MDGDGGGKQTDRNRLVFAVLLAVLAGWVDASAFIHWHGLFVSFMGGNSTKMVVLSGSDPGLTLQAASAIIVFVVGVILGELLCSAGRSKARPLVLAVEAAALWAASAAEYTGFGEALVASLLGVAMGLQNASVHRADGISVAVTYVTGTLVHIGRTMSEALNGASRWRATLPYLVLWLGLVLGGLAGAFVAHRSEIVAMLAAAAAATLFAIFTSATKT